MEILIKAGQFLLSLSFLIVLHELGHFIPARLFKTRVEKFFLFFDIKGALFQRKIGETVYGIGWLPAGRLCQDRRHDRRVYGQGTNGQASPALGIPI